MNESATSTWGMARTSPRPDPLRHGRSPFGKVQPDIVHFDDQRDRTIDHEGDADADRGQRARADPEIVRDGRDFVERDRHDFGRKDEVGADRAGDALAFERGGILDRVVERLAMVLAAEPLDDLFGPFVGKIGPAEHQQDGDRPGQEPAQQERAGQQDEDLVLQAALGDLPR